MPTQTLKNPYRGVNAHLHSIAQNPAKDSPTIWTSFHASHIVDIINALNTILPMNYVARAEQSLQIWTENPEGDLLTKRSPRPDASIYQLHESGTTTVTEGNNAPVRVIEINPFLEEEITIPSAVIYELQDHELHQQPVTRIELLSASNKRGGTGEDGYRKNRLEAIRAGSSLIELDYLHQSGSPLPGVPLYPDDPDSHAYYVALTDRRPSQPPNIMHVYIRDVDQALPSALTIPLANDESITFDVEAIYQQTFHLGRWGNNLDYTRPPRNFDSYSPADQSRIKQVMERVQRETEDS